MSRPVDAVNRLFLLVLALLLLAAGALALAVGAGALPGPAADDPVLPEAATAWVARRTWLWWVASAVALLLAVVGLRWLLAQLRVHRVRSLDLTTDDRDGITTVRSGALAQAVEADAERVRGVQSASAHVEDEGGRRLVLAVALAEDADIAAARRALESRTVAHVRQALDEPDLPVDLELRPAARAATRTLT